MLSRPAGKGPREELEAAAINKEEMYNPAADELSVWYLLLLLLLCTANAVDDDLLVDNSS